MQIRLGTRSSPLARWQAEWVAGQLRAKKIEVEMVLLRTQGDRQQDSLSTIGGQGVFTREIQNALLDGRIDVAVHSLKDLPTEQPPDLLLAAIPQRAPCGDVFVSRKADLLENLPRGSRVGTGSQRRRAQILHLRPDLQMMDIRGNVDTRLKKLLQGDYDALILAEAGLLRLGLAVEITQRLPLELVLPAVGQGALVLEIRAKDEAANQAVMALDHPPTHVSVMSERALLAALQGGCLAPIAAWGRMEDNQLRLSGRVISPDGRSKIDADHTASPSHALQLGKQVAQALLDQGAGEILDELRQKE